MTLPGRDAGEIEALVTDRYLDALLAGAGEAGPSGPSDHDPRAPWRLGGRSVDEAVRAASRRLAEDLPRFHPSFRFEERLAVKLAEAAAAMRLPLAAGTDRQATARPVTHLPDPVQLDPLGIVDDEDRPFGDGVARPVLVRGAVAASALSLAGAAWYAWRHRPSGSPMARAIKAAHGARAVPVTRTDGARTAGSRPARSRTLRAGAHLDRAGRA